MGFRVPMLPAVVQEQHDAEIRGLKQVLREIRFAISRRDEGLIGSEEEMTTDIRRLVARGLGER